MSHSLRLRQGAAALALFAAVVSCQANDNTVLGPATPIGGAIFKSYVSLGNSITAGYQSGGINDSTQRRAYPVLLAQQFGTPFAYPSLTMPGCPPPVASFTTGARVGGGTSTTCLLRSPSVLSDVLNNVAVPGATSFDPTSASTASSNTLTTLILGGQSQVQRALDAKPTFASVWIGNNDVLVAAEAGILTATPGISPGMTPTATFISNYATTVNALVAGAPGLKGVLIGVVQVSGAPAFTAGGVIAGSPALQGAISQAAGTPPPGVTVLPNCATSPGNASLISLTQLIPQIAQYNATHGASGHPPVISCVKGQFPPSALVGDIFVIDTQEQATLFTTISAYNAYIHAKADSVGFAYWDPNILLASFIANGSVPPAPNFAAPTAPYGTLFSLDGIHPSAAAHILIANGLITAINGKYATSVAALQ